MGFDPDTVDRMSLRQFNACCAGYAKSKGLKGTGASASSMSDAELKRLGIEGA
jgi:hypothetical protein